MSQVGFFFQISKTRLHTLPLLDCTLGDGVGYPRNETLSLNARSAHSEKKRKKWNIDFFLSKSRNVEHRFFKKSDSCTFELLGAILGPFQRHVTPAQNMYAPLTFL